MEKRQVEAGNLMMGNFSRKCRRAPSPASEMQPCPHALVLREQVQINLPDTQSFRKAGLAAGSSNPSLPQLDKHFSTREDYVPRYTCCSLQPTGISCQSEIRVACSQLGSHLGGLERGLEKGIHCKVPRTERLEESFTPRLARQRPWSSAVGSALGCGSQPLTLLPACEGPEMGY